MHRFDVFVHGLLPFPTVFWLRSSVALISVFTPRVRVTVSGLLAFGRPRCGSSSASSSGTTSGTGRTIALSGLELWEGSALVSMFAMVLGVVLG